MPSILSASAKQPVAAPGIHRVLNAAMLLKGPAHQLLLNNMRESLAPFISSSEYIALYDNCIKRFCEYVQRLQATKASFYAHAGGMMDLGLDRARVALAIRTAYRKHNADPLHPETIDPKDALWDYAIFTAALLMDLGRMVVQYDVTLCDHLGRFATPWIPLSGPIFGQSHYYRVEPSAQDNQRLAEWVTPLIAEQVLPHEGLKWLGSDARVLEEWLALLHGDFSGEGMIVKMILWAQAQVLSHYFSSNGMMLPFDDISTEAERAELQIDAPVKLDGDARPRGFFNHQPLSSSSAYASTFVPTGTPGSIEAVSTAANPLGLLGAVSATIAPNFKEGVAFLQWLKRGVNGGRIGFKGAQVWLQQIEGGAVQVRSEAFRAYAEAHPKAGNMRTIQQQLTAMGIVAPQDAGKNVRGILINPYVLVDNIADHIVGSNFIDQFSMAHLAVSVPQ